MAIPTCHARASPSKDVSHVVCFFWVQLTCNRSPEDGWIRDHEPRSHEEAEQGVLACPRPQTEVLKEALLDTGKLRMGSSKLRLNGGSGSAIFLCAFPVGPLSRNARHQIIGSVESSFWDEEEDREKVCARYSSAKPAEWAPSNPYSLVSDTPVWQNVEMDSLSIMNPEIIPNTAFPPYRKFM